MTITGLSTITGLRSITYGATYTYATWNPSDKDSHITLSGGNLIATGTGGVSSGVRSTIGKSSGKWYWEVKLTNIATENPTFGVSNATAVLDFFPGNDTNAWTFGAASGLKYNGEFGLSYSSAITDSDVLGIGLDMDVGNIVFYKNGISLGVAYSGITGTIYAISGGYNCTNLVTTANFGATTMAYTAPSGYNQGLYN